MDLDRLVGIGQWICGILGKEPASKADRALAAKKSAMKTPCIKVCQMDPARGVCSGCCRTLDEIARWGGMSDAERDARACRAAGAARAPRCPRNRRAAPCLRRSAPAPAAPSATNAGKPLYHSLRIASRELSPCCA